METTEQENVEKIGQLIADYAARYLPTKPIFEGAHEELAGLGGIWIFEYTMPEIHMLVDGQMTVFDELELGFMLNEFDFLIDLNAVILFSPKFIL